MGVQSQNWFMDILRQIFGFFDEIVYGLFSIVLQGIFDISGLVTNSSIFNGIYQRIYVVLGVFMAFKLAFSFFQYLVDPDQFTDKSKGVGKLFMHVFIMLFALMFLPTVLFSGFGKEGGLLPRAQQAFLPVLPKIILGSDNIGNSVEETVEITSKSIVSSTLGTFFHPAYDLDKFCNINSLQLDKINSTDDLRGKIIENCTITKGDQQRKFLWIFNVAKVYTYSYLPIISTAVGVLLLALLLAISIDLAKRCFKLVVLEMIAPIPIMSLIDPASGKGESAFSKWSKNLLSTFLDIFIKVGLVYVILVFLDLITTTVNGTISGDSSTQLFFGLPDSSDTTRTGYLVVLLIIGLIYFAKEAPKFIKESLGMKADKGGMFDDVKSLAKTAGVIGGVGLGAGAAVARSGAGSLRAAGAAFANREGFGKVTGAFGALVGGAGSAVAAAISGGVAGRKGVGKNGNPLGALSKGWGSQAQRNATRVANAASGSTMLGRTAERARQAVTGRTGADLDKAQIDANKAVGDSFKSFDEFLGKKANNESLSYNGHTFNYGDFQRAIEHNDQAWAVANGFSSITDAASNSKSYEKTAKEAAYGRLSGKTQAGIQKKIDKIDHAMSTGDWSEVASMGINSSNCVAERAAAEAEIHALNAATSADDREAFGLYEKQFNQTLHEAKLEGGAHSYADMNYQNTEAKNSTLNIQTRKTTTGANRYQRRQANANAINKGKKK